MSRILFLTLTPEQSAQVENWFAENKTAEIERGWATCGQVGITLGRAYVRFALYQKPEAAKIDAVLKKINSARKGV